MVTFPWFKAFQKKIVISMGVQIGFPIFLNVSRETIYSFAEKQGNNSSSTKKVSRETKNGANTNDTNGIRPSLM